MPAPPGQDTPAPRGPVLWAHSHFLLPTGGTKYIFEVVRRLSERRPVEVAVEQASDYWRERYAAAGVPLHEIASSTSTSKRYWLTFPHRLRSDRRALDSLVSGRDVGSLVSSFFPMNHLLAWIGEDGHLRHVHLCFEPFPFFHDREVIGLYPVSSQVLMRGLGLVYGRLDRDGVRRADALLTLNEVTAASIARVYGRDDAIPIYAGVDLDFFHPYAEADLTDLRERHGSGRFAIHSTDFSPIKRTDLALRAFAAAGVTDARLLVTSTIDDPAGLAAMRANARALGIADQVDYLGFVPYEEHPPLLLARRRAAPDRHLRELGRDVDVAPGEGGARMRHRGHPLRRHRGGCRGRGQRIPRRPERPARRRSAASRSCSAIQLALQRSARRVASGSRRSTAGIG